MTHIFIPLQALRVFLSFPLHEEHLLSYASIDYHTEVFGINCQKKGSECIFFKKKGSFTDYKTVTYGGKDHVYGELVQKLTIGQILLTFAIYSDKRQAHCMFNELTDEQWKFISKYMQARQDGKAKKRHAHDGQRYFLRAYCRMQVG